MGETRAGDDLVGPSPAENQAPEPHWGVEGLPRTSNERSENTARATAAVWTIANWYGSVFAGAVVNTDPVLRPAISPSMLALTAVEMVLDGESTWDIIADEFGLRLAHLANAQVYGKRADPMSWFVRAYTPTPSGQEYVTRPWGGVSHTVRSPKPDRPWKGTGILAGLTSRLLWTAERHTIDRLAGPHGTLLEYAYEGEYTKGAGQELVATRGKSMPAIRGQIAQIVTDRKFKIDTKPLGGDLTVIEQTLAAARMAGAGLRDAALLPIHFMPGDQQVTASALKEALIHFVESACKPLASIIGAELSAKLGRDVELDFSHVGRSDVRSRSTALTNLVKAGVPLDEARKLTGFTAI